MSQVSVYVWTSMRNRIWSTIRSHYAVAIVTFQALCLRRLQQYNTWAKIETDHEFTENCRKMWTNLLQFELVNSLALKGLNMHQRIIVSTIADDFDCEINVLYTVTKSYWWYICVKSHNKVLKKFLICLFFVKSWQVCHCMIFSSWISVFSRI